MVKDHNFPPFVLEPFPEVSIIFWYYHNYIEDDVEYADNEDGDEEDAGCTPKLCSASPPSARWSTSSSGATSSSGDLCKYLDGSTHPQMLTWTPFCSAWGARNRVKCWTRNSSINWPEAGPRRSFFTRPWIFRTKKNFFFATKQGSFGMHFLC